MELIPVQPTPQEAQLVMHWRNDPVTLAMSFHQEPKIWESFYPEFLASYFLADLPIWWGVVNAEKIGLARFRHYDLIEACDIGIMIAPQARGQGYSTRLIQLATQSVHDLGWKTVIAEIKPVNSASIRAFEGAGYQFRDELWRKLPDLPDPILIKRYHHAI